MGALGLGFGVGGRRTGTPCGFTGAGVMLCLAAWGAGARRRLRGHPHAGLSWGGGGLRPWMSGIEGSHGGFRGSSSVGGRCTGTPCGFTGAGVMLRLAAWGAGARRRLRGHPCTGLWRAVSFIPGLSRGWTHVGLGAANHVEGRVTRGLSLGRLRAPALSGRELPMPVCARKATGTALAAPHAAKALKPLELRCPVQRRH